MSKPLQDWELTREALDRFLDWLDADREQAGRKYEAIRRGLIALFNCRGCSAAEDLADETINRSIRQLSSIEDSYEGDPAKYIHGIARFVALEYFNRQVKRYGGPAPEDLPDPSRTGGPDEEDEREALSRCLRRCLEKLTPVYPLLPRRKPVEPRSPQVAGRAVRLFDQRSSHPDAQAE